MNDEEKNRLKAFALSALANPDEVGKLAKVAKKQHDLIFFLVRPEYEEAVKFIEGFIKLNPERFAGQELDDDNLLIIAEIMRIVAEEERKFNDYSNSQMYGALALREAALESRKFDKDFEEISEEDEDKYYL